MSSASTPEGKVKQKVIAWLKQRGVYYAMPVGGPYGRAGIPDFLCCYQGHYLAIETKAPGKRSTLRPSQAQQIAQITHAGGSALIVDDVRQLDEWERQWMSGTTTSPCAVKTNT
ncbi:MAG: hypothetical protein Q4A98_08710 [Comamonadaceae bacterium]|nr:hypothetical protein [Comamonadaceae bacterium]